MDAGKIAAPLQIASQTGLQFRGDLVGIALELLGAVFGELGNRRLGREPGAGAVLIEIGRGSREPSQRVAEHGRRFPWPPAAELHTPVFESAMGSRRRRR